MKSRARLWPVWFLAVAAAIVVPGCSSAPAATPSELGSVTDPSLLPPSRLGVEPSGVLKTGSYRIRHPQDWRFVAYDPSAAHGIVIVGVNQEQELTYVVERADSQVNPANVLGFYEQALLATDARFAEAVVESDGLDIRAFVALHNEWHLVGVIRAGHGEVLISTICGPPESFGVDVRTIADLADLLTHDTTPDSIRRTGSLPEFHAPDGAWNWIADTPGGFVVVGELLERQARITIDRIDWTGDGSDSFDHLFWTGNAVYYATIVEADSPHSTNARIRIAGPRHAYRLSIETSGSLLEPRELLHSADLRRLIGQYLTLDETGIPR